MAGITVGIALEIPESAVGAVIGLSVMMIVLSCDLLRYDTEKNYHERIRQDVRQDQSSNIGTKEEWAIKVVRCTIYSDNYNNTNVDSCICGRI